MAVSDCIEEVYQAAGRELTDDELSGLADALAARQRRLKAEQNLGDDEAALKAAEEIGKDLEQQAIIEKRNAALNLVRRVESLDFVRTQFAENPALGVEALLTGVNTARKGSRYSVATQQNQLREQYLAGFVADVEKNGHWKLLVRGEMDRDIARAMWTIDNPDAAPFKGPREAMEIAEAIHKWQEVARAHANRAGAWIGKEAGYITRQSHDMHKIGRVTFQEWRDAIFEKLDFTRTFEGADNIDAALLEVYTALKTGVHLKANPEPGGFKGPANIAKKASAERVLHFKSADDWSDYNAQFGTGSLRESVLTGLSTNAQNTGLMRILGPNAESNFDAITDALLRVDVDPEERGTFQAFTGESGRLRRRFRAVDGTMNNPVNHMQARIWRNVRAVQSMAKLGGAVLSALADIPIYASEVRYTGGGNMLSGMGEAITNLVNTGNRRHNADLKRALSVVFDSQIGEVTARFSGHDDLGGRMSRAMQAFFKFNGLTFWTENIRTGHILMSANRLAERKNTPWANMSPDLKRALELYGLDGDKWDIIRQATELVDDGRSYVTPEAVAALDDAAFKPYLNARGLNATQSRVRNLRDEIEGQLRSYYVDRADYAVIEPDQRTRSMLTMSFRPGTVEGEAMRLMTQFKSFPVAVIQKTLGREVYGRGAAADSSLIKALRNGNGEMLGLTQLLIWTTLFGYGAMTMKDLSKGRTPRDPTAPATWGASMLQGGAMGIYGDFLFGELKTRFGGGPLGTALGPTAATTEDIADLIGRAMEGDDLAAKSLSVALSNTPFANLFYTRAALDYLFLYQLRENLNPGYLRRMEKRVEKENNQEFILKPSQTVRQTSIMPQF